jgi:hypothetical protein
MKPSYGDGEKHLHNPDKGMPQSTKSSGTGKVGLPPESKMSCMTGAAVWKWFVLTRTYFEI